MLFPFVAAAVVSLAVGGSAGQPVPTTGPPPAAPRPEPEAVSPSDVLNKARRYFDYGDYPAVSVILRRLDITSIESRELRIEAYRLLGLSLFYQGKRGEAYRSFLELLYLDPDYQMDPFYVPPAAAAAFDEVRRDAEAQLAPVREQQKAEQEARRRALEEEAARRRKRAQEEEQRRLAAMAPTVERRVVQREFWVNLLPFGIGQFQNGDRSLGIALATTEVALGATSAGSALLIEGLRDSGTGKFGDGVYPLANRLRYTKWISAGLFYALWIGGAIHAVSHYQPESTPVDRLVTSGALPEPTLPNGSSTLPRPAVPAPAPDQTAPPEPAPAQQEPAPARPEPQ